MCVLYVSVLYVCVLYVCVLYVCVLYVCVLSAYVKALTLHGTAHVQFERTAEVCSKGLPKYTVPNSLIVVVGVVYVVHG